VNRETQTVSPFFPKLWGALQKKLGPMLNIAPAGAMFPALIGSAPAMQLRLPDREVAGLFDIPHRT
jgi:hypothetical protein